MNKATKIIVTIGLVILFIIIFAAIVGAASAAGRRSPGILGLIVFGGFIGGLRAIWKSDKKDDDQNKNDSTSILQK